MKRAKKKRLERGGWKVGGTRDFLDLTEKEAAMSELKLARRRRSSDEQAEIQRGKNR